MVCTLRHLIFRTWATVLVGGVLCLLILPAIHSHVGLEWALVPVAVIFSMVFMVAGWLSNRVGMSAVERLAGEATKWERAGLLRSAEKTYKKALAVLDSFLLSPLVRRRESAYLAARLARFYLARADKTRDSEVFLISYLESHPEDGEVAEDWLRQVEILGELKRDYYELASRIGNVQAENTNVQHLLARLYLAARRTDFPALQTYRHVLDGRSSLAADIVRDLAVLFIREGRADEWALTVYLQALRHGGERPLLLKGIAACVHWIGENERTRIPLREARGVLEGFNSASLEKMRAGFKPPTVEPGVLGIPRKLEMGSALRKASKHVGLALLRASESLAFSIWRHANELLSFIKRSKRAKLVLQWSMTAVLVVALGILVVNTVGHLIKTRKGPPEKKEIAEVVITDPFTIQVAAYLKPEDAQGYVSYLKKRGLDAYWRKREGTKKTYYQVRVSHFADKVSAKAYGASLKAQGIIEDFYVANYERP
jgi:hypothetical protein